MLDYRRNFTDSELTQRINLFWFELEKQCAELNSDEFEYYWEYLGILWTPWSIEINRKSLKFSANDISSDDLEILVKQGKIKVIKIYETHEMQDEFERIRYRIIKNDN